MAVGEEPFLVVPADENIPGVVVTQVWDLTALQKVVGGFIEGFGTEDWHGYCNEEGKLQGLPGNHRATMLAWCMGFPEDDVLVGDVVFAAPDGIGVYVRVEQEYLRLFDPRRMII